MSSFYKSFDKELFNTHDEPGKYSVRKYFEKLGFIVANNPDDYSADLILFKPTENNFYEKISFVEVGVRESWKGNWPGHWDLRIEKRKAKYLKYDLPVIYCVLNNDHSKMIMLEKPLIYFPLITVNNKYSSSEENYSIKKEDFKIITLKEERSEDLI